MENPLLLLCVLLPALASGQQSVNSTRPLFPCGGQLTGDQGHVASESFPAPYPPNKKCSWTIRVSPGRVIILSFRHMDLESDPICRYDHVSVYNGDSPSAERLGRFCGTIRPGALISTGNTLLIQMESDEDSAGRGFLALYTAGLPPAQGNQFCGGKLVKPQGSFKTPNWPEKAYPTGITCTWHIVARPHEYIELQFEKFGVEGDTYCRYDYVAVFNGGRKEEGQRVGKFCGDTPPGAIVSEGNELLVQFVSDLSVTADGFLATYDVKQRKGVAVQPEPTIAPTTTTTRAPRVPRPPRPPRPQGRPLPPICQTKCGRKGTLPSNFCASDFVISGKVLSLSPQGQVTVSIIHTYKAGNLATREVGGETLAKMLVVCRRCPNLRKGTRYTLMGPVDPQGRGRILPTSFFLIYKPQQHQVLTKLTKRRC
ncbi:procollagen C-endopeptidase enhancer 2-like [Pristis pectinata]|uniref:procollagen C-endopeptidase enhancer 2-like n=1 Tax=Pristis pectinata TaxID=685728 RepID=UPI00223D3D4B|nr:procollagen C-endopeptidase enhancer 2-like [Pristis pectinata]